MKKKILCTMMSMVMVASLFAGCGTDSGTENSASDNSKTEETGQTTSDDPYAAYAGTTISVAAIETGYGSANVAGSDRCIYRRNRNSGRTYNR